MKTRVNREKESREKTHQVWEAGAEMLGRNSREGLTEKGTVT